MKFSLLCLLIFSSTHSFAQKIDWFAAADFLAVNNENQDYEQDVYLREFELALYSKVDQDWSAALSLVYAKGTNSEEAKTELHEVYLQSSSIFAGNSLKLGQFFLGVGKLNRIHRHEWGMISAPVFFETYFGEEGALDSGVEYTHGIGTSQNIQLTLGLTKGGEFVHEHSHEEEASSEPTNSQWPTHYLRLAGFHEFNTLKGLEYGLNYLVRKDQEKTAWFYSGLDMTFKKREGKKLAYLIQTEYWSRTYKMDGVEELADSGYYIYFEKGLDQHHSIGLGVTGYSPDKNLPESLHKHEGRVIHEDYSSLLASYTFLNSEFVKYRFSIEQERGLEIDSDEDATNHRYQLQLLFNIGKHPIHLF